jgi:hypothetical protein
MFICGKMGLKIGVPFQSFFLSSNNDELDMTHHIILHLLGQEKDPVGPNFYETVQYIC